MATQPRLVNKQFNSPINLYSDQNVREVLQREAQMLGNGAVGINFYNPAVGKPSNLQNSAVLRMLEEEENRQRNGQLSNGLNPRPLRDQITWPPPEYERKQNQNKGSYKEVVIPGTKRVAWPPPREGEEFDEQAAVQSQGGTQSSTSPGLQNNFSSGRQSVSPAPQSRVPLKPLDISSTTSSISYQQSLKSPVQNQSPIGFRPQTPTRQWAPVQSPVTTHPPQIQTMQQYNQTPQQYQQQQTYKQTHQTYQQTQQYQRQYETSQQQYQPASYHYESSQEYHTTQNNQTPQVKYQSTQQQVQSQYRQQYQPPQQQNQTPQQQYQPPQQQYQPPQQQYQPPQQQYQPPQQQYQPPQQQYQPPQQQYQAPKQQYQPPQPSQQQYQPPQQQYAPPQQNQPPQQQYQPPQQQYQSQQNHYQPQQYPSPQQQPQSPQQYQTTPSQPPNQQVFAKPGAASSQAPNQYKPVKNVEPPPSTITLRPQPPVSQPPPPVFSSQPATATLKGGKHLRGDLKWPPENVKRQMEEERRQRIELAKGPAVRPKKVVKDYTPFFAQHALNSSYPGYKIPPGTQFYRPV